MKEFWKAFRRNKGAVIGLCLLLLVLAVSATAPLLAPDSPWKMVQRPFLPPLVDPHLPLGTDTLGRDVMSGILHGARISLMVGVVATTVALLIGIPLGAIAGYYNGIVDDVLMRIAEFFQTIPSFALALVLVAILEPSVWSIILSIGIVSWVPIARLVRAEVLSQRSREYVEAAVLAGQSDLKIILHQILPNTLSAILVISSLTIASAILLESALSFIGLGDPNLMSWGYMIGASRTVIRTAWWLSFFPGLAIFLTVLAFNMIGDGLNDALNPRLNRTGR
ncbi:ABC transporter permease [Hoeflea prorocentri]|uniref:ABC transporter permease n=1 Tax=Hoeflea prorocentri TaxID=1922333 RepID=A0A9X3UJZ7_9HYPH|nr:ABC transporter permease [Hoeflea prorocentri]MCY6381815.1 ABC transporter permease [Hoeflea prorocentri]MDA5399615.1 ABC transporter permease [Hoeflea prorocentri]